MWKALIILYESSILCRNMRVLLKLYRHMFYNRLQFLTNTNDTQPVYTINQDRVECICAHVCSKTYQVIPYISTLSAVLHISISAYGQRRQVLIFPWLLFDAEVLRCRFPYGIYLRFVSSSTHQLFSMRSAQTSVDFPLASLLMQKC